MTSHSATSRAFRIGYLTAIETPDGGFVAGLLVTNRFGRPVEFQCTSPVRPTRPQQLLYGATLQPFLLGELMGRALVERLGTTPDLLVTDHEAILELRNHIDVPMACVASGDSDLETDTAPPLGRVRIGQRVLTVHSAHDDDAAALHHGATQIAESADLQEPLGRVRLALQETLDDQDTHTRGTRA